MLIKGRRMRWGGGELKKDYLGALGADRKIILK